jgi:hypothetical protein
MAMWALNGIAARVRRPLTKLSRARRRQAFWRTIGRCQALWWRRNDRATEIDAAAMLTY